MHWLIFISSHKFMKNLVYRFIVGFDPPSDERDSRRFYWIFFPNFVYLFGGIFFTGLLVKDGYACLAPFMAACLAMIIYSFRIIFFRPSFVLRHENRTDLITTKLTAAELLNGAAMPLYQAMSITLLLHGLLCLFVVPFYPSHPHLGDVLSIMVLDVCPCFCLLTLAALAAPFWTLTTSKIARAFLISVTIFFLLWVHLFIFATHTREELLQQLRIYVLALPFWASLLGFIIVLLWRDAIREFKTNNRTLPSV